MINDGLHTMGQAPDGERLIEFLVQLTRLPNSGVPSLREALVGWMGYDYDNLLAHRGEVMPYYDGQTGGQLIARAHERAVLLISALAACDYDQPAASDIVRAHCDRAGSAYRPCATLYRRNAGAEYSPGLSEEIDACAGGV